MNVQESAASLVSDLVEACNLHDAERLAALCSPYCVWLDVSDVGRHHGLRAIRQSFSRYVRAFPDVRLTVEDVVAQEGCLAVRWTARATHQGTWMHIPPTERAVTVLGMSMLYVDGGKVNRAIHLWDLAGLLRCLRLLPELNQADEETVRWSACAVPEDVSPGSGLE